MVNPVKTKNSNSSIDEEYIAPEIIQRYVDKFNKANISDLDRYSKEATLWFSNRIRKDTNIDRKKLLRAEGYRHKRGIEGRSLIGKMFFFNYDAETPGDTDTGFYDKYPLIFIFNFTTTEGGNKVLWGINFHYLTARERFTFLVALMKLKNTKGYTTRTKLRLEWDMIKALGSRLAERAVHAYRVDRFLSKLIEIDPRDWNVATFLRTELFLKPKSEEIIRQSYARSKIRSKAKPKTSKARHESFAKEFIRNKNTKG